MINRKYPSRLITEDRIIGKTFEQTEEFLKIRGYFPRVINKDSLIGADNKLNRVNIEIKDDIVTKLIGIF